MKKLSIIILLIIIFAAVLFTDEDKEHHETITTRINEIKVFVRDSEGNHISGISKEDIKVLFDKKELKISYIDEISDKVSKGSSAKRVSFLEKLEKTETTQIRPNFFVFILSVDNTGKKDTDNLRSAIEYFIINTIKPADYVVFSILDARGLRVIQNPTNNQELAKEILNNWIESYESDQDILPMNHKKSLNEQFVTLTRFIEMLRKIPDSKNVILLTNGVNENLVRRGPIMITKVEQDIMDFMSISKEPLDNFLKICEISNATFTVFLYKNDMAIKFHAQNDDIYSNWGYVGPRSSNDPHSNNIDIIKEIYGDYSIPTLGFVTRNGTKSTETLISELDKIYNMQSSYYLIGIQTEGEKIDHSDIDITIKDMEKIKILVK